MRLPRAIRKEASLWYIRLHDEAATPDDLAAFEIWLDADPRHEAAFMRLVAALGEITAMSKELSRARVWPQDSEPEFVGRSRSFNRRALLAAPALALGIAAIGYLALAPNSYATTIGERRIIALPDGGRIDMNTDTQLSVRYSAHARLIRLERGEAAFDVGRDGDRPFVVEAGSQNMRTTGAQFAVRLDADALAILVTQGALDLGASPTRLLASQRLQRTMRGEVIETLTQNQIDRCLAWRAGFLQFDGEPLSQAVKEVARYHRVKFVIGDARVRDLKIVARFRADDLNRFLDALQISFDTLTIERRGDEIRISQREQVTD